MPRRRIAEFMKSSLGNSGRAMGTGIVEDNYGDEYRERPSFLPQPQFEHKRRGVDGDVVIVKGPESARADKAKDCDTCRHARCKLEENPCATCLNNRLIESKPGYWPCWEAEVPDD